MKLNFPKQIYEIVKDLKYSVDNIDNRALCVAFFRVQLAKQENVGYG